MIFSDEKSCTGCSACSSTCPRNAISIVKNEHGFSIPVVDRANCIDCHLCEKVCPQISLSGHGTLEKTYAFIHADVNARKASTSGGFFIAAAAVFIEKGGFVCGCILEQMKPKHIVTNRMEDVFLMHGSKYVQSDIGNCLCKIGDLLLKNIPVLFTGTSCQVAGLKSYLKIKNIKPSQLFCIDFICHGVPSEMIWDDYVKFYEKTYNRRVVDFKFRSKKYGWGKSALGGDYLSSFSYYSPKNNIQKLSPRIDDWSFLSRIWRYIFFSNLCLREVCYNCKYSSLNKPSDITMADFWGIEKTDIQLDYSCGCSLIICNTASGEHFLADLKGMHNIAAVEKRDAISEQLNVHQASPSGSNKEKFWNDYLKYGFPYVLNYYFNYNSRGIIKAFIKRLLFEFKLRFLF